MKPFIFTIAFCLIGSLAIVAQDGKPVPKHTFKFGFGTTYLNNGNYFGKQRYLEYDRRLFRLMSLGLNASHIAADQVKSDGFEQYTKAIQGEATLFISPINNAVNSLKLGFGGVYRHTDYRFTSLIETENNEVINKAFTQEKYTSPGWSAMLEYEVFIARHLVLGSRASFQKFDNQERVFYWGLNAGIRF